MITHPCRICGQQVFTITKWSTASWIWFLIGFLTAPICIGVVLMVVAYFLPRESFVACDFCGRQ